MKTLMFMVFLVFFVLVFSFLIFPQDEMRYGTNKEQFLTPELPVSFSVLFPDDLNSIVGNGTNGWFWVPGLPIDSLSANTSMNNGSQFFSVSGITNYPGFYGFLFMSWRKEFWDVYPLVPDSISIKLKYSGGENVEAIGLSVGLQDSSSWASKGVGWLLPLVGDWVTFTFSTDWYREVMDYFGRVYIYIKFQMIEDSTFCIGSIDVDYLKVGDFYDDFDGVVGVEEEISLTPTEFTLEQNYPNPFNPSTTIRFFVPERGYINLSVFNSLGEEVKILLSGEKDIGTYEVSFDASDLPSGVYFYRLQAGSFIETKKMIFAK